MLSEELYSKPTHFLLELIQNADDNKYAPDVTPKLSIVYRKDGYLWVGCNELGFTAANVEAICRIAASTKKVEGSQKGYIGEKGIGFKSVFKVADSVWIKSGALQFRFDKNKPLGMIAPFWAEFHGNELMNERTMFCFRIPDLEHRKIVQKDVVGLEPELLLFLRQLRCISVTIQSMVGITEKYHTLERHDEVLGNLRRTSLARYPPTDGDACAQSFVVCQHTAKNMPFEPKRFGVSESDMLIAFPVDDELSPVLRNRRVYNFLPIREYGFSFILQADFMLGANREDVLQESAWNMCLISATAQLFVESVKAFNQQDILKYSWPRYLTSQGKTYDSAFSDFFDNLLRSLRARPVLESQALTMQHPQELESVRAEFTDGTHPLFTGPRGLAGFAHNGYNPVDLANLSVAQQSATQFLSLLEDYLKTQHGDFTQRSPTWHSSLAAAILVIDPKTVKSLRLIPLRSGQWVSAKGNKLFFPDVAAGIIIPQGIDVDVVEDSAVEDEARRSLYTALGVCTQDEAKVFDLILQQHARHSASSTSWCVADVVEHAWFLFRSESQPATFDLQKLLLFSGDGLLHHGQDLYMDTPNSSNAVSKVLGEAASDVHYLHEQYLAKAEGFPVGDPRGHRSLTLKWTTWLQQEAGVRTMPKLVVNDHISPEFESLINASSNNQWLQLLKDGWHVYKADLEAPANARLRNQLTDINVLCLDGQWRKLSNVYLPSTSVLSEPLAKGNVPMVVVRDADDYGWRIFGRSLRLHMAPDAQLFIRILLRMRQGACGFSLDDVKRMYSGVSRNFNVDAMNAFSKAPLVYIASPKPAKWVTLDACRWEAPPSIITLYALDQRYKQNQELFVHKLRIGNAVAGDVVAELAKLSGHQESIGTIRELLSLLSQYIESGELDRRSLDGLVRKDIKILPVQKGEEFALKSFFDGDWFIADDDHPKYVEAFRGNIWFVAADDLTLPNRRILLEKLGCLKWLLSLNYKIETRAKGPFMLDPLSSKALRDKAKYFSRLVDKSRQKEVLARMLKIEVKLATAVIMKKYVMVHDKRIYAADEDGLAALEDDGPQLEILINSKRARSGQLALHKISDALSDALGISKALRSLTKDILITDDTELIESELEHAGLGVSSIESNESTKSLPPMLDMTKQLRKSAAAQQWQPGKTVIGSNTKYSINASKWAAKAGTAYSGYGSTPGGMSSNGGALHATSPDMGYDGYASTQSHPSNGRRSRHTTSMRNGGPSDFDGKAGDYDYQDLDMSSVRAIIDKAVNTENDNMAAIQRREALAEDGASATVHELTIGRAGEAFVFEFLKAKFGVGAGCWTSESRDEYGGLAPFTGDESVCADFTITNPSISKAVTEWLVDDISIEAATQWLGKPMKYHIEVKTTTDRLNAPFDMSNNQMELARDWHESRDDVMVVLRVYQIMSGMPCFHVYVDPVELSRNRILKFRAKGGFEVYPA